MKTLIGLALATAFFVFAALCFELDKRLGRRDERRLRRWIRRRSPDHRRIVLLYYADGLTAREIAYVTGLSFEAVEFYLSRVPRCRRDVMRKDAA